MFFTAHTKPLILMLSFRMMSLHVLNTCPRRAARVGRRTPGAAQRGATQRGAARAFVEEINEQRVETSDRSTPRRPHPPAVPVRDTTTRRRPRTTDDTRRTTPDARRRRRTAAARAAEHDGGRRRAAVDGGAPLGRSCCRSRTSRASTRRGRCADFARGTSRRSTRRRRRTSSAGRRRRSRRTRARRRSRRSRSSCRRGRAAGRVRAGRVRSAARSVVGRPVVGRSSRPRRKARGRNKEQRRDSADGDDAVRRGEIVPATRENEPEKNGGRWGGRESCAGRDRDHHRLSRSSSRETDRGRPAPPPRAPRARRHTRPSAPHTTPPRLRTTAAAIAICRRGGS